MGLDGSAGFVLCSTISTGSTWGKLLINRGGVSSKISEKVV